MASNHQPKVLFVSAEVAPFATVGGLSQVSYFLPRALLKMGVDVRIFTPKYGTINESKFPMKMSMEGLRVPTGEKKESDAQKDLVCNVKVFAETKKGEPTVYFLENMEYFEKRSNVYGYSDDHIRFGLLSRGAVEFIKREGFDPDVIHLNDWHTAYVADYCREIYGNDPVLKKAAILLTIHNLFQGNYDFAHASPLDFDDGKSPLEGFFTDRFLKQNALKRGVMQSDVINTVSETYAAEIMSHEFGKGLEDVFKEVRGKLYGVLNGLDFSDFNPGTDKTIKANFSLQSINKRLINKADIQKQFNLKANPDIPLLAFWGRLDSQKGIDLVMSTIEFIISEMETQFVIVGPVVDNGYREFFLNLEKKYPGKVGAHLMFDRPLVRKVAAGADMFLLPSCYEPGGIVAMEALRYGAIPIVRATGGLADVVFDFNPANSSGNGFVFKNYAKESFLVAIIRALETYRNKGVWHKIIKRAMEADHSWAGVAQKYLELYQRTLEFRREALAPNSPMSFRQTVV